RLAVRPQQLAVRRVQCDDIAPRTGHGIEFSVDVARRGPAALGAETGAVPYPGFLEVGEIAAVDLRRRGVARVRGISAQVLPRAAGRAGTFGDPVSRIRGACHAPLVCVPAAGELQGAG